MWLLCSSYRSWKFQTEDCGPASNPHSQVRGFLEKGPSLCTPTGLHHWEEGKAHALSWSSLQMDAADLVEEEP